MHQQQIDKGQAQVLKQLAPFCHRIDDGSEIVIQQHYGGDFPRTARAARAHRHANSCLAQRGHIVDTVACDGNQLALRLQRLCQRQLLRRGGPCHHVHSRAGAQDCGRVIVRCQHHSVGVAAAQPNGAGNRRGCGGMIAGDHDHAHACHHTVGDGLAHPGAHRVFKGQQARQLKALVRLFCQRCGCRHVLAGATNHLAPGLGVLVHHIQPVGAFVLRQCAQV